VDSSESAALGRLQLPDLHHEVRELVAMETAAARDRGELEDLITTACGLALALNARRERLLEEIVAAAAAPASGSGEPGSLRGLSIALAGLDDDVAAVQATVAHLRRWLDRSPPL
jgi:hypothetical protein